MVTPHVTENPLRMAAVTPDPFAGPALRRDERLARERRLNTVRSLLRTRNASPARRTRAA